MAITKKSSLLAVTVLTVAAVVLTVVTAAVINVNQNVTSSGTITASPNIGVYFDSGCTTNMTTLNWGSITAGASVNQIAYVKNIGTGTLTLSPLTVTNWNPSGAATYITISWNQTGTQLTAGQSTTAMLTLTVSSSVTGITTFSNTIVVTGSG